MTNSNVEKVADLAVPDVGDLDGWTAEDHLAAHAGLAVPHTKLRLIAGVLLWNARRVLADGEYGAHVEQVAEMYGVEPRSLGRWRLAAERERGLGPATPRSATKQENPQVPPARRPTNAQSARSAPVVKPDQVTQPKPAPARQQLLPGAEGWGLIEAAYTHQRRPSRDEARAAKRLADRLWAWAARVDDDPLQRVNRAQPEQVASFLKTKR